jgi:hypothetical protein
VDVSPFGIERYYARHGFTTRYMLSRSDCESRTIAEVLELEPDAHERLNNRCGHTESPGSPELREAIAAPYERIDPDGVIVTSCAEEGILLLYQALLGAGDHAISGPIGFPRVTGVGNLDAFCGRLANAGVLQLLGSVYDEPGHARVGFGRANLPEALDVFEPELATAAAA